MKSVMAAVQQYNKLACAAACLRSVLSDLCKKDLSQEADIVKRDYDGAPFELFPECELDGKRERGALITDALVPTAALENLAAKYGFNPEQLGEENIRKDFPGSFRPSLMTSQL